MALRKNLQITTLGRVLDFTGAYIRVARVEGDKNKLIATVDITSGKEGEMLKRQDYVVPHRLDGGNSIAQSYEHLKSLVEFADAEDC